MAKSKKKKKNTRISAEEKAALRQERSELRAKQNRKAILALGGLIICAALLIAMLVGAGSYIWTNRNGSSITAVFDENDTLVAAYQDGLDK